MTDLEKKLVDGKSNIEKLNYQLLNLQKQLEQNSLKKRDIKKQLDMQELKVKTLQEQEKQHLEVVESVSNSKEFDAASKELEFVKFERNTQEQKMLHHMNKLEHAEKEYATVVLKAEADIIGIQVALNSESLMLQDLNTQIAGLQKERISKLDFVPEQWLDLYENMRGKVNDPVVAVNQESCSACFYLISSRDLQALYKQELLQCKDCDRFLYCDTKK